MKISIFTNVNLITYIKYNSLGMLVASDFVKKGGSPTSLRLCLLHKNSKSVGGVRLKINSPGLIASRRTWYT